MALPIDPATLCRRRTTCRICQSGDLELALPLTPTPIASLFLPKPEPLPVYPLDVVLCRRCGLVQLLDTVDPVALYSQATERTARDSPGMAEHFQRMAESLRVFKPASHPFAVEVGSNDGCLLGALKSDGWRAIGVDPCDLSALELVEGVEHWVMPFTQHIALDLQLSHGYADLIVANNVLANVDDLNDFAEGIRTLLAPDGVFVLETGYLGSLVEHLVFDNIYHEHLSYFSVMPLIKLFADHGLELFDVEVVPTKGGSLRGFVQHYHGPRPHTVKSVWLMAKEEQQRLLAPETYRTIGRTLARLKGILHDVMTGLHTGRLRDICGFGASHSVVTLLHHFEIADYFEFVVDDNPVKHGLYVPGTDITVRAPTALSECDYTVILPWRFADMIISKHPDYQGRFIVPVPEVRIV